MKTMGAGASTAAFASEEIKKTPHKIPYYFSFIIVTFSFAGFTCLGAKR